MTDDVSSLAARLLDECRQRRLTVATAESCTGGLVAAAMTDIAGSSDVFDRGFITYSNTAKRAVLDVPAVVLGTHGAVSRETARAMADGALVHSQADIAVAITGIAGPGGGTPEKPVGLVHLAGAVRGGGMLDREMRFGDLGRNEVRRRSVVAALELLALLAAAAGTSAAQKE